MSRLSCDDFRRLCINDIDCGPSAPAWQYPPPGSIAVSVVDECARVICDHADLAIAIVRTRCNYGGVRAWWQCPECGRRCGVLYGLTGDGGLGCRKCQNLGYASDKEDTFDRMERKQRKLEAKLGVHNKDYRYMGRWNFVAEKPKRMRWWTYDDIQYRITKTRNDALHYLMRKRL